MITVIALTAAAAAVGCAPSHLQAEVGLLMMGGMTKQAGGLAVEALAQVGGSIPAQQGASWFAWCSLLARDNGAKGLWQLAALSGAVRRHA
jgi:hypothetical protein